LVRSIEAECPEKNLAKVSAGEVSGKNTKKKVQRGLRAGLKAIWAFSIPLAASTSQLHRKRAKEGAVAAFWGFPPHNPG
jgi:hypothetical protein